MDPRSVHGALMLRELGILSKKSTATACAEALLLQHAVSHYCPLAAGAKSTIAAAYLSGVGQSNLLATSHGDHTIKLHSWPGGAPVHVLQENGHVRTPWTVSWAASQPRLLLSGALDGRVILWDVASGRPLQQVEAGKTVASCCLHPCGKLASYCTGNRTYMWQLDKPWPCLLHKAKRVMRMVAVNPGQPDMLLTGELVSKDCTGSQLLQATPAHVQAAMRLSRRRAAVAAADRAGLSSPGQYGQGAWEQQQQQQAVLRQHSVGPDGSSSDMGCAGGAPQQQLAGVCAGDARAVVDAQQAGQLPQQQQYRQVAGEQQQLLLQAVQRSRHEDAGRQQQQQQQQQVPGCSPTSTTLLQRLGASLWSRGNSRPGSTAELMPAAVPTAAAAPSELAPTSAAGAEGASQAVALAASVQQLLAALRKVSAAACAAGDDDDDSSCSSTSAQQLLARELQSHNLCSADEVLELCCMLRCVRRLGHVVLHMPGFRCSWGLDVAGSDAQLRLCGGASRAGDTRELLNSPIALDSMVAAAAGLQALSESCAALQAAAAAVEAGASRHAGIAAAADVLRQLTQELMPVPASMTMLRAVHGRQQLQQAAEDTGRPCLAVLRIWRLHAQQRDGCGPLQQLAAEQQLLVVPFVVLCSERSVGVSPCGRVLVAVVAVWPGSSSSSRATESLGHLDASKRGFHQAVAYELRVISLEAGSMGQVLAARSMAAADCLTCVQVSPTGQHVLLAYGRRSKQLSCLVAGQGSYELWHTVLQVYRMSDLALVRQMVSREDEVNVAAWHPCPGQGITYGTKSGRVRNIVAGGSGGSCRTCPKVQAGAAEATSVLQQALQ